jgi:small GTP-binding protein
MNGKIKKQQKNSLNSSPDQLYELKIAVLGKSLVGKSALTYRFINDKFPTEHDTTIEDQYRVNVSIEGFDCRLEILDTAGQDDYQTMIDTWIGSSEAFILVYAIDDRESFDVIKGRYERIKKNKVGEKPIILLAGNKCDLVDKRKVESKEAEDLAKLWNVNFLEVSALEKINVKETFLIVAKELLLKKAKIENNLSSTDENKKRCFCF